MTEHLILNDGHSLPEIGFGTYPLRGEDGYRAVRSALDAGYRLIDSAVNYGNEEEVGRGIRDWLRDTGTDRDEVVVQTKLPGRHHAFEAAIASGRESLATMGLDRIDVLLIHWPNPSVDKYREAWRALVQLRELGVVRTIGTSNFTAEHLAAIVDDSGVTPAINQIELHPYFPQAQMRAEHERRGIVTQSWSPLGKASAPYEEPAVLEAAKRHEATPAQVILRWHVELGAVPLPKSGRPERQAENLDIFEFELSDDEVEAISALGREDGRLFGGDPNVHEEM